jgi:hypothetical protein
VNQGLERRIVRIVLLVAAGLLLYWSLAVVVHDCEAACGGDAEQQQDTVLQLIAATLAILSAVLAWRRRLLGSMLVLATALALSGIVLARGLSHLS